jgi:hypothetical protein
MKRFIKIFMIAAAVLSLSSCKNSGRALLPNVAGKAGEILVVLEKGYWDTNLGNGVRDVLARPFEYLPQREPTYSLVNISPGTFTDMFKYHRNILIFNIDPAVQKQGVVYRNDVWAHPQCVIQINASNADSAAVVFAKNGEIITSTFEQAERNRIIANDIQYEEKSLSPEVEQMVGGKLHFPFGYELKKKTSNFLWFEDERQYTLQGVFVYKYPVVPNDTTVFDVKNIVAKRNEFLKDNVPGMFDNTYMTTSEYITPGVKYIKYHGREFVETRGLWEVYNDYMGGPFVSHSFYSQDGKEIIVLEAWVYAAKYDKRQYLRQTESILYSFSWLKDAEK